MDNHHHSQRGFALGLILLVVVLMAIMAGAMSLGSRGSVGFSSTDEARGYATHLRSMGGALREAIINLQNQGIATNAINRSWDCNGRTCLQQKLNTGLRLNQSIFAAPPSSLPNHFYKYWTNDRDSSFASGTALDVYFLRFPVKTEICTTIEALNQGRSVRITDLRTVNALTDPGDGTSGIFDLTGSPVGLDGCAVRNNQTFYFVVIGRACGGDVNARNYWPC